MDVRILNFSVKVEDGGLFNFIDDFEELILEDFLVGDKEEPDDFIPLNGAFPVFFEFFENLLDGFHIDDILIVEVFFGFPSDLVHRPLYVTILTLTHHFFKLDFALEEAPDHVGKYIYHDFVF